MLPTNAANQNPCSLRLNELEVVPLQRSLASSLVVNPGCPIAIQRFNDLTLHRSNTSLLAPDG